MTTLEHHSIRTERAPWALNSINSDLLPHIIPLGPNLWGASFKLMKMVIADYIIDTAIAAGDIGPETMIVESTSGTLGLALAMKAAMVGRPITLVTDPAMDPRLCRRVEDLGAIVEMCHEPSERGEYQSVRLARLAEVRERHADSYWTQQYDNPLNPAAYEMVADHLVHHLGRVDALIGTVGSGGSMSGTAQRLRHHGELHVVGVDTPGSVLFGQPEGVRELRGLGNSILPGNLKHQLFDEVHWIPAALAYESTRDLHRQHALFHGPTSGAAVAVANEWSTRNSNSRVVVMLPDLGDRYLDTVYNDAWLDADPERRMKYPLSPQQVQRPVRSPGWTWMNWGRRSLAEVAG